MKTIKAITLLAWTIACFLQACAAPTKPAVTAALPTIILEQPTPPPSLPSDIWDGKWSSFIIFEDGSNLECRIALQTAELNVTGTLDCDNATGTIRGTLSEDFRSISGFVDDSLGNKNVEFKWELIPENMGQFNGWLRTYAWCGNRETESFPRPCTGWRG